MWCGCGLGCVGAGAGAGVGPVARADVRYLTFTYPGMISTQSAYSPRSSVFSSRLICDHSRATGTWNARFTSFGTDSSAALKLSKSFTNIENSLKSSLKFRSEVYCLHYIAWIALECSAVH